MVVRVAALLIITSEGTQINVQINNNIIRGNHFYPFTAVSLSVIRLIEFALENSVFYANRL